MGRRSGGAGEPLRAMCAPRARRRARNAREGTFRPGQAARSARSATARARGGALILFGPMASFLGGRLLACMTPLLGPTTGPRLCMGRAYGVARGCCGGGSGRAADGVLDQVCGNDYRKLPSRGAVWRCFEGVLRVLMQVRLQTQFHFLPRRSGAADTACLPACGGGAPANSRRRRYRSLFGALTGCTALRTARTRRCCRWASTPT